MVPTYLHTISYKFKYAKNMVRFENELFVVDHEEPAIFVFSTIDGKMQRTIGKTTNPQFSELVNPKGIFITDYKLFVSDKNGVHIFGSNSREYLDKIPFDFKSANAISMSSDELFISDENCIHVFSKDYSHMYTIGEDKLENVSSICYFEDKLYVADEELCQVLIFDKKGHYITSISSFNTPKSIFVSDTRNELFVANTYNNQIVVFDARTYKHLYNMDELEYVYSLYAFDAELYLINSNKVHVFRLNERVD